MTNPTQTRCSAHNKQNGKPCGNPPMNGARVCRMHGGKAPQVKRKAELRVIQAKAWKDAEILMGQSGIDEHPIQHMLRRLYHSERMVEILGAEVTDLRELAEHSRLTDLPELHPLLAEFGAWCDRNVKYAKTCLDAGVQEREVRIAEQQGQLVVEAFRRSLADGRWGLTAEQKAEGMKVFGRHLRAVGE